MTTASPSAEPRLVSTTLHCVQLTFDTPDLEKAKEQLRRARDAGFTNAILVTTVRSALVGPDRS